MSASDLVKITTLITSLVIVSINLYSISFIFYDGRKPNCFSGWAEFRPFLLTTISQLTTMSTKIIKDFWRFEISLLYL